jgi:hypothetical protein
MLTMNNDKRRSERLPQGIQAKDWEYSQLGLRKNNAWFFNAALQKYEVKVSWAC